LGDFLQACCEIDWAATVTAKELFEAYVKWAEQNKEKNMSKRAFGLALAERGFEKARKNKERFWRGLKLADGDA